MRRNFPISSDNFRQQSNIGTKESESLQPYEHEGVVPLELQHVGRQQPGALSKAPEQCSDDNVLFTKSQLWQDEGKQGKIPDEILSSDNLVEGDKYQGLAKHGKVEVVDLVELEADHEQEDDLGQKCDQIETNIFIFNCQIQKVEVNAK